MIWIILIVSADCCGITAWAAVSLTTASKINKNKQAELMALFNDEILCRRNFCCLSVKAEIGIALL